MDAVSSLFITMLKKEIIHWLWYKTKMIKYSDLSQLKNGIIVLDFTAAEKTLSSTNLFTSSKKNKRIKIKLCTIELKFSGLHL